jgi:hypothetical protein
MLFTAAFLVLGAGLDLFLFPEATDTMFAWSIQPALTAAFLGANYLAAGVLEFGAARQITWARARVAVPCRAAVHCPYRPAHTPEFQRLQPRKPHGLGVDHRLFRCSPGAGVGVVAAMRHFWQRTAA